MVQLRLAKVCDSPPDARVDQSEDVLPSRGVGSFGDSEVRYACVERSNNVRLIIVILGVVDSSLLARELALERLERGDIVGGLLGLLLTLLDRRAHV